VIRSMTGFGRGEAPCGDGTLVVEVRAVNSRFLDLRVRLPRELSGLEPNVRAAVQRFLARGQVEVQVRLPAESGPEPEVVVDEGTARRYLEAATRLRAELGISGELSLDTLFGLPGVVRAEDAQVDTAPLEEPILRATELACGQVVEMREREGRALASDLRARAAAIGERVEKIEACAGDVARAARERLERRLAALAPELEIDPSRLDQEVVIQVDRMDVTEETVRLRSHLAQFVEALDREGAVGRRLEFLLQELGRETNTVGSKAGDAPLSAHVVEIKTELEKLREQVLNVE
jgi:uncharacterized protein (TIGR00255 family)